jgi:hypothetical protein
LCNGRTNKLSFSSFQSFEGRRRTQFNKTTQQQTTHPNEQKKGRLSQSLSHIEMDNTQGSSCSGYVRKTPDCTSPLKTTQAHLSSPLASVIASACSVSAMAEFTDEGDVKKEDVGAEILAAQQLAETEVAQLESEQLPEIENSINVIPRLLQGAPDVNQLVAKTQEFKAKGQQLDLLLLKAETYSHFIRENQERSKKKLEEGSHFAAEEEEEGEEETTSSSKKRKKSSRGKAKPSKAAKAQTGVPLPSSTDQDPSDTFRVTKTLVGGTLMSYQKEGLKWLLSLWENGLSGILADEM